MSHGGNRGDLQRACGRARLGGTQPQAVVAAAPAPGQPRGDAAGRAAAVAVRMLAYGRPLRLRPAQRITPSTHACMRV